MVLFFCRSDSKHASQFSLKEILNRKSFGIKAFFTFYLPFFMMYFRIGVSTI